MEWKIIKTAKLIKSNEESNDVLLEKKKLKKDNIKFYRGSTNIDANISNIAFIIDDINTRKQWVSRLSEEHVIEQNTNGFESFSYELYNMTWPVKNRDYVLRSIWNITSENSKLLVTKKTESVLDEAYPEKEDVIRGYLYSLLYTLKEIDKKRTNITVEIQVDPRGDLPQFIINKIQKNWPLNTLRAIQKQTEKTNETHHLVNRAIGT